MKIKILNRGEAQVAMADWLNNYPKLPKVDNDYVKVREDLQTIYKHICSEASERENKTRNDYLIDAKFAIELYKYLEEQSWFTLRIAENDGFWRYLSIVVVPDLVAQRWGKDNSEHYYSKPTRIWLRSLWWYIFLAWQGNVENTRKVIESSHFTTDTILNFEERSGRKGTCIEAYRRIIYYYSLISVEKLRAYKRQHKSKDDLFRVVMKLNTAKMMIVEPELCIGGVDGYARSLFKDAGVDIYAS